MSFIKSQFQFKEVYKRVFLYDLHLKNVENLLLNRMFLTKSFTTLLSEELINAYKNFIISYTQETEN